MAHGSSRLGINTKKVDMLNETEEDLLTSYTGEKLYEMSNHLDNVLTVINDIKVPYLEQDNLLFKATIMRTYDYSPFGVQLDGRSAEREFCESETNEVTITDLDNDFNDGTIQGWLRTSTPATVLSNSNNRLRIRRRPSHSTYTPTTDSWDSGIPIDAYKLVYLEEGKQYNFSATVDRNTCVGITVRVRLIDENGDDVVSPILSNPTGITYVNFNFEPGSGETGMYKLMFEGVESTMLCNFNVDDILITHVEDVTTYFNCVGVEGYRYGYQGSEKDDEVKGEGNSYTTEFRLLDPRLGRWLSIDPLAAQFPWQSPYCSMDNNPMCLNDILGLSADGEPNEDGRTKKWDNLKPITINPVNGAGTYQTENGRFIYQDECGVQMLLQNSVEVLPDNEATYRECRFAQQTRTASMSPTNFEQAYKRYNWARFDGYTYKLSPSEIERMKNAGGDTELSKIVAISIGVPLIGAFGGLFIMEAAAPAIVQGSTYIANLAYQNALLYHNTMGMNGGYQYAATDLLLQLARHDGDLTRVNLYQAASSLFIPFGSSVKVYAFQIGSSTFFGISIKDGVSSVSGFDVTSSNATLILDSYGRSICGNSFMAFYWNVFFQHTMG